MEKHDYVEKLLNDFVFLDCRLGSHPKVRATVWWKVGEYLTLSECAPGSTCTMQEGDFKISMPKILSDVFRRQKYFFIQDVGKSPPYLPKLTGIKYGGSFLSLPLKYGEEVIGALSVESFERAYFKEELIGSAQLLAALLVYARMYSWRGGMITPASIAIGEALKRVREEIGLTQSNLAGRINKSRISVSRWESGAQPPSIVPLYEWCHALGLFSSTSGSYVTIIDITPRLLKFIEEKPERLRQLSPEQFEKFVAGRMDRMGYDVTLTGVSSHKDGGIDLIAVPKIRTVGSFLLAGQIKHHHGDQKTGRDAVDRLLAWKNSDFRLGLLVTNTYFTKDARWVAFQVNNRPFIRLRDFEDLKRWIENNFWSKEDWLEIPDEVNLAPAVTIVIPKPRLPNSLEIWPLGRLDLKDIT